MMHFSIKIKIIEEMKKKEKEVRRKSLDEIGPRKYSKI